MSVIKYKRIISIPTGVSGGITSLNSQTGATQTFATGTSGTDFAISSSGNIHTFNIPSASTSNRGLLTTSDYTRFSFDSTLFSIYRSGQWLSGNTYTGLSTATGWTIDRIRAIPFVISEDVTLSGIRVEVTTNIAASKARLGIYSDSNGYPGSLLVDAGEVDCSTLGLKSIVISQALTKSMKRVWLAVNISHSTIGFRTGSAAVMILGRPTSGGTKVANSYMVTSTYGALPSTYPAGGAEEASAVNTFLIEAQIA